MSYQCFVISALFVSVVINHSVNQLIFNSNCTIKYDFASVTYKFTHSQFEAHTENHLRCFGGGTCLPIIRNPYTSTYLKTMVWKL